MPARVKVRAVMWLEGKLVVHRSQRRGKERMTLPGGWVAGRESVIAALKREVQEELGIEIDVGDLLCAAEVVNASSLQDVELVFTATPRVPLDPERLTLIDPLSPQAADVLPPILDELARRRRDASQTPEQPSVWLGNAYRTGIVDL
jgi:8-oxo-dGTP pyrophosphatase MutT (NUDIX family)